MNIKLLTLKVPLYLGNNKVNQSILMTYWHVLFSGWFTFVNDLNVSSVLKLG